MNIEVMGRVDKSARALDGKVALVTGSTSGIGLGIARALAGAGADIVLNGFGTPDDIAAARETIEGDFGVRAVHLGADMSKPAEIADACGERVRPIRPARRSRQQRRHPACRQARRVPGRKMGRHSGDQSHVRVPHDAPRASNDAAERLRPHRQHCIRARSRRLPLQVGLCRGEARPRRASPR